MKIRSNFFLILLAAAGVALAACGDDDGATDSGTPPPPPPPGGDMGTPPPPPPPPPPPADMGVPPEDMGAPPEDMGTPPGRSATVVDCAGVTPAAMISWSLGSVGLTNSVGVGDVVQWTGGDGFPHTVTSGTPLAPEMLFDESIRMGTTVCVRFDGPGAYPYFCSIHPSMMGTINVE